MTNEIKEILDIFKQVDLEADVGGCSNCPRKDKNRTCIGCLNNAKDKLLDYITNLQEEKQRLLESADCLSKGYSDLEKRIDKATNYILENICCDTRVYTKNQNVYKVVDILRGDE